MRRLLKDKVGMASLIIIGAVIIIGAFAPVLRIHDPYEQDIFNKYAAISSQYPLGTDNLGRCIYSRLIYGIQTTVYLAIVTMISTIVIGTLIGLISGFFKGFIDEAIMRLCDVMLSFPSQVMILAIVGILGVGIKNVIIANIAIKWVWYARMIRGIVTKHRHTNYILYSTAIGTRKKFIILNHLLPNIFSEIIVLATLDMSWIIINISTLSFLGLGVQPPTPEWGAMLNEAKSVMFIHPEQMLAPGFAILILVTCFNLLGDSLRDTINPKET